MEKRQVDGKWLGIQRGVFWKVFLYLPARLIESVFLPSKQIKTITSLFINLVRTVISLIQEMPLCIRLRSMQSTFYGFPVATLIQIRIKN